MPWYPRAECRNRVPDYTPGEVAEYRCEGCGRHKPKGYSHFKMAADQPCIEYAITYELDRDGQPQLAEDGLPLLRVTRRRPA